MNPNLDFKFFRSKMILLFPVRVSRTFCSYTQIYFLHTSASIGSSKTVNKKYSDTICLPKTSFPGRLEGKKRVERDLEIVHNCKFNKMYDWQRENRFKSITFIAIRNMAVFL